MPFFLRLPDRLIVLCLMCLPLSAAAQPEAPSQNTQLSSLSTLSPPTDSVSSPAGALQFNLVQRTGDVILTGDSDASASAAIQSGAKRAATPENSPFASVLGRFVRRQMQQGFRYAALPVEQTPHGQIFHYRLQSQSWDTQGLVQPALWQHEVAIYMPASAIRGSALLFANNGDNGNDRKDDSDLSVSAALALANATHSLVITINNIPNQPLQFQGEPKARREDELLAQSWRSFLADPQSRAETPLLLPMSAALSQAMTLVDEVMPGWEVQRFILAGVSKRAWAVWLSSMVDTRVAATVTIGFDLLDTTHQLAHIYRSLGGHWPMAFRPYYDAGIDQQLQSAAFRDLMQIIDPMRYHGAPWQARLAIPRYIVSASGDDFSLADSALRFITKLPGHPVIRMVPNIDHNGLRAIVPDALRQFLNRFRDGWVLPRVRTRLTTGDAGPEARVSFSETPVQIQGWSASTVDGRDFRYRCGVRYSSLDLQPDQTGHVRVTLPEHPHAWHASFVEATFADGFIATTPAFLTPHERFPQTMSRDVNGRCANLPGRT